MVPTLIISAYLEADAREKKLATPGKCNDLIMPNSTQAPLESFA